MDKYLILFIGTKPNEKAQDNVTAARYETLPDRHLFYNDSGKVVAQYERQYVSTIRKLEP